MNYYDKKMIKILCSPFMRWSLVAVFSLTTFATSALADCNIVRPLRADEFSPTSAQVLLNQMVAVCSSITPERWATLSTRNVKTLLAKMTDTQRKAAYTQYCSVTRQAVDALGGSTNSSVHTLKIDDRATECGQKISTWYVHSASGARVLRLEVAKQDGLMKINTH